MGVRRVSVDFFFLQSFIMAPLRSAVAMTMVGLSVGDTIDYGTTTTTTLPPAATTTTTLYTVETTTTTVVPTTTTTTTSFDCSEVQCINFPVNKGANIPCPGDISTCTEELCCEQYATCDTFACSDGK